MQVRLEVAKGPHKGRSFTFDGHDNFIVGRAECAHFRLSKKDPYFSRVHFMVEVNPPQCRLVDMGSTNGTLVRTWDGFSWGRRCILGNRKELRADG